MLRTVASHLLALLALASAIATLILFRRDYFVVLGEPQRTAVLFIGCFSLFFFLEGLYWRWTATRDRNYGNTLREYNEALEALHEVVRTKDVTEKEILTACERACTLLAQALREVTGVRCAVCVKALGPSEKNELAASTLIRDAGSHIRDERAQHLVSANSDFDTIIRNLGSLKGRYYLNNWMPFDYGYRNSSFRRFGEPPSVPVPILGGIIRWLRWPLPYRSTLVLPIGSNGTKRSTGEDLPMGFLCADSPSMNSFRIEHDVDLLAGVASGLHSAMRKLESAS